MNFLRRYLSSKSPDFIFLNTLHILNDGFEASYILLLPFIARELNINLTQVGALDTLMSAFGIILALPAGYIAVRFGGFKTLIFALLIYAVGFLGIGVSSSYLHMLLAFALGGTGLGLFHPIGFALIARRSSKEKRGRAMGNFTAVGELGKIGISTVLTFIVIYLGLHGTAFLYGTVALLVGVFLYLLFLRKNDKFINDERNEVSVSVWHIIKNKQFILASATNVLDSFASQTLFVFLPFLLLLRGVSPALLGFFAGAFFVGNLAGKIFLGRLVDKYDNTKVFIVSEVLMALFIFLLANTTPLYLVIVFALVLGIFTKGTIPVVKTMVSESVEHHGNFEKAYGVNSIAVNCAITISPLVLGIVSDKLGIITAFNVMAVIALTALIPAIGFRLSKKAASN